MKIMKKNKKEDSLAGLFRIFEEPKLKKKPVKLEIERKFLMKRVPRFLLVKGKQPFNILHIVQYYVGNDKDITIRYRESKNAMEEKSKYFLTKKKYSSFGTYEEDEKRISKAKFDLALKNAKEKTSITKTRMVYEYGGLKFEIDRYQDLTLVILEVELKNIKQKIKFPKFIKDCIIKEVTGMKELSNRNLAEKC
jgi:CYTH domain-containing protein